MVFVDHEQQLIQVVVRQLIYRGTSQHFRRPFELLMALSNSGNLKSFHGETLRHKEIRAFLICRLVRIMVIAVLGG